MKRSLSDEELYARMRVTFDEMCAFYQASGRGPHELARQMFKKYSPITHRFVKRYFAEMGIEVESPGESASNGSPDR